MTPDFSEWLAICNLKARYCRLLDTRDWDGWKNVFTEDFVLDVTDSGGEVLHGRDAIVASVSASLAGARTSHQVHSPEITVDGDIAYGIWAMNDRVIWSEDRALTGWGHYHEHYRKTAEGWQIAEQKLTRLCLEFD